ncbi:hypothetical protein [Actinocrispum sp. NPDC049592]|uniref:hypothetical protein n=1 Tax=Actinocrispum sp. NPDC049592 TaxID=3154835 RepID=UPI00341E3B5A
MGARFIKLVTAGIALGAGTLLSACTSQNASAPPPATSTVTTPAQVPQLPARTPSGDAVDASNSSTVDKSEARFPDTTQTVWLTGYDAKVDMVQFKLTKWQPGGPNNGHYVDVPGDTGVHRLPLASNVTVLSVGTLCLSNEMSADSKGNGTAPCSKDVLLKSLKDGIMLVAEIKVDGTDHIAKVSERYTP